MKVEELQAILDKLDRAISQITGILVRQAYRMPLAELEEVYRDLDQHRLEMEAAETQRRCNNCGAELKERQLCPTCSPATAVDAERLEKRLAETPRPPNSTPADVSPEFRLDLIEKRLDEMPARFRKAITAHFYDQRERIAEVKTKSDDTREAYLAHMTQLHKELSVFSPVRPPVPSVEVEMRIIPPPREGDYWTWECCLARLWMLASWTGPNRYCRHQAEATVDGDLWLAECGACLGVKLVPKWVTEQP